MRERQWSKTRKRLEQDLLCEALRGRVRYFATRYRGAHDQTGRVCIVVDGKEILNMPYETEFKIWLEADNRKVDGRPPAGMSLQDLDNEVAAEFMQNGVLGPWQLHDALDEFFVSGIEESLQSLNPLVRMLAILDRRVGKRTLVKLKSTIEKQPAWLQYFYQLRFESEGL